MVDLGGSGRGARKEENVFDIQTAVAIVTLVRHGAIDRTAHAAARYTRIVGSRQEKLAQLTKLTGDTEPVAWTELAGDWHAPLCPPTGGDDWLAFAAVADLFPWQQPGCQFGRTSPVAPSKETLERRWARFVSTADIDDRARCFAASRTGRNIHTKVSGLVKLADEAGSASPQQIVRYAYRSFDRQWAFDDPRWAKTESPSLWWSATPRQVFMTSMMTNKMSDGPAATVAASVPDFHHFRGSYGGKDVIPLYRDSNSTPNADLKLLTLLTDRHKAVDADAENVSVERLFAYTFGVLAGTDYTERFHEALETPGPRVPLSADPELFARMVSFGERLIWLQTFGERYGKGKLPVTGVRWNSEPTRLPVSKSDVVFDPTSETLCVADGVLSGVPDKVWKFAVSGMEVIPKWLGYRMAKSTGRAASSDSPLDHIRPTTWVPEWSTELIEIVAVLKETLAMVPDGIALLDEIVAGAHIGAYDLPPVPAVLRQPPKSKVDVGEDAVLFGEVPG